MYFLRSFYVVLSELEIWALGITLFVLIFFENPFIDIEETLHSDLHLPHTVSAALERTLTSMLDKNPQTRYTMKQLISDPWITQVITSLYTEILYYIKVYI